MLLVLTSGTYLVGAGRSLDYDSSVTTAHFVATPSLLDPFRREYVLNNHPLFSFADHVVYSLGGHGVAALRVLPALFGALTVAVLAFWCARRWGVWSGAAAGVFVAANPMFADLAREIRGYSLLALAAVLASILLARLLARAPAVRWDEPGYAFALAAGVATHLYGLLLIPLHAIAVVSEGQLTRRWIGRWLAAAGLGGLAYVGIISQMWAGRGGRAWTPGFMPDLISSLLGTHAPAIVASVLLVLIAVVFRPPTRSVLAVVLSAVAIVLAIWLVAQPAYLFPRFFVWLVPGIAVLAARAVSAFRPAILLIGAYAISAIVYEGPTWVKDPLPTRAGAQLLRAADEQGYRTCVAGHVGEALAAYHPPPFTRVERAAQLAGCDVVLTWSAGRQIVSTARRLPYRLVLAAQSPFVIFSRVQPRHFVLTPR